MSVPVSRCGLSKPARNTRFGLLASDVAQRLMQKIFIDYVGKLPRSKAGNSVILVCVDAFSKFVWLIPVRQATTKATIRALQERIFSTFSVPEVLVSDNAQCFTSREFQQFCFELGVKNVTTSPYYLQPSHVERFNRNLRSALIAYHSGAHATWDQNLLWLQLAFNTAEHESTKVIFPFRAGSPLINQWKINELFPKKFSSRAMKHKWMAVKQNLLRSQAAMALQYNRNHVPQPFKVGDLVYYRNHPISHAGRQITAKLLHRWKGPFRIDCFYDSCHCQVGAAGYWKICD
jgi:hypothetical protein